MAPYIEFEGKNVKKAVKKACEKLKIEKGNLKYEIISHGSTGIFGLAGIKKAKIGVALTEKNKENVFKNKKNESYSAQIKTNEKELRHPSEKQIDLGKDVLQRIIDSITEDAKIEIKRFQGKIIFNVAGGNAALLIGKRGQTLDAIQSIIEKIINKKNEKRIRIQIDIERYMEKRRSNLKSLARRLAEKCKRIGKPVALGEMNAHDRRIVHVTLKNDKDVRTKSTGEGLIRKIVILPNRNSRPKKDIKKSISCKELER